MKKLAVVLGSIILLLASPCFADFKEHYDLGQQYFFSKQYSSSIDEFKKALRINYLDNSARIGLVNAYLARGTYYANDNHNYSEAADDFRSAIFYLKYYPKDDDIQNGYATTVSAQTSLNFCLKELNYDMSSDSRYQKAEQLRMSGNLAAAIYELEQIRNVPKFKKIVVIQIADMFKILGNNERAADFYKVAIDLNPHNGPLIVSYARLLDKLGRDDEAIKQYNIALSEGDTDREILYVLERIYRKKLENTPDNPELNANLGAILQKQQNYVEALEYYKKAENLLAGSSDIDLKINTRLNIGTLFQAQKNYTKAIEVYKSILYEFPQNQNANLFLAQCYEANGDKDKALDYYEKVLSLDPTDSTIRQNIVSLRQSSMTPEQLLEYIDENSQVDKSMVDMLYDYAVDYHKKKDMDNAIKFYRAVLKYNKNKADIYTNIALCYVEKKDYDSAREILTDAQKRFPNNKTIANTLRDLNNEVVAESTGDAYAAYEAKDYNKAIELYSAIKPQTKDTYLGIAASYEGLNDTKNAIEFYKKAFNLDTNNADIAYSIGALYCNLQEWYNAKSYLQKSVVLNPGNQEVIQTLADVKKMTSGIQLQKGADLFNKGKYDESLKALTQAIADDSTSANAYYYRGLVYDNQNKRAQAISDYKKTIEYDKEQYMAYYLMAIDYDVLTQYKTALSFYKKFIAQYKTEDEYLKYAQARVKELARYGN